MTEHDHIESAPGSGDGPFNPAGELVRFAEKLIEQGDVAQALECLHEALTRQPENLYITAVIQRAEKMRGTPGRSQRGPHLKPLTVTVDSRHPSGVRHGARRVAGRCRRARPPAHDGGQQAVRSRCIRRGLRVADESLLTRSRQPAGGRLRKADDACLEYPPQDRVPGILASAVRRRHEGPDRRHCRSRLSRSQQRPLRRIPRRASRSASGSWRSSARTMSRRSGAMLPRLRRTWLLRPTRAKPLRRRGRHLLVSATSTNTTARACCAG